MDLLSRLIASLAGRLDGPMMFRLIAQPMAAVLIAARDGWRDLFTPGRLISGRSRAIAHLRERLRDGWRDRSDGCLAPES
jgi:hypothetical protein